MLTLSSMARMLTLYRDLPTHKRPPSVLRVVMMGGSKPHLDKQNNPIAHDPSFMARTLTFLYLPTLNLASLVYPVVLCCDWASTSIPPLRALNDPRVAVVGLFYAVLGSGLLFRRFYFFRSQMHTAEFYG